MEEPSALPAAALRAPATPDVAPPLLRPSLLARRRDVLVLAGVMTSLVFGGGMLVGSALEDRPAVAVSPPVAHVTVPAAPAPIVHVTVPVPAAPATEPDPAPTITTVEQDEEPPPPPRAVAPRLWAQCLVTAQEEDASRVCSWDDGFPAVSADGATIAVKHFPDDTGRGNPGLYVRFLDARTGKLRRTAQILSPEEWIDPMDEGATGGDDGDIKATADKTFAKLRAKVIARAAAVQRTLDDGGYRTMIYLGGRENFHSLDEDEQRPRPTQIYAEVDRGAVRVIDPVTNTVLWQQDLGIEPATRATADDDTDLCGGWSLHDNHVWWEPTTRIVLSAQRYRTGGCMCSVEAVDRVARIP